MISVEKVARELDEQLMHCPGFDSAWKKGASNVHPADVTFLMR